MNLQCHRSEKACNLELRRDKDVSSEEYLNSNDDFFQFSLNQVHEIDLGIFSKVCLSHRYQLLVR